PAAAAANIPAPAPAGVASSARSQSAPTIGTASIALTATGGAGVAVPPLTPTVGPFAASTSALSVTPTVVANLLPTPTALHAAPPAGAVVVNETHRVPVALVRAGEILLALLALAGITLMILSRRAKTRRA
ncbi:MAG: hypothetical protein LC748_17630, partial [Thermomicrobia bacterium]|nr:hypothetical protein [Thermomicrobia bacterium]